MHLCVSVQTSAPSAAHAAQVSHGHFQPSQVTWWHACQPRAKAVHTGTTRHSPVHVEGNSVFAVSISLIHIHTHVHMLKVCACCVCVSVCLSVSVSIFLSLALDLSLYHMCTLTHIMPDSSVERVSGNFFF